MRKTWLYLALGLAVVAVFWCCIGLAGIGWVWSTVGQNTPQVAGRETPAAGVEGRTPTDAERETGRLVAAAEVPERDLVDLAHRFRGLPASETPGLPPVAPAHNEGDVLTFWLHDVETNSFFSSTATLSYATAHAYWWIEQGYEVAPAALERSARNFEDKTYPTDRRVFGSEWSPGIDGDVHLYIFLGRVPGVAGYYSPPDEYPLSVNPHSNQHEMFYISLDNAMPGNSYFDGVLAHEFQHMIHWAEDRDEDSWVNEGLAELAAHVNGYDVGGSDQAFTRDPDTQLTTWSELEDSAPHYGASYLFMAYLHDRYGDEAIRRLVSEPANGIAGVEAMLAAVDAGRPSFSDVFGDWILANYMDQPRLSGGRYGYTSLSLDQPRLTADHTRYPAAQQAAVHQYAADYIALEGKGDVTVEFTGSTVVPTLGNQTHSGLYQWWSNRSDEADARLTRAFDLRDVDKATLQAWMWYELEKDYDYAYVEVSADGGQTWTILSNEHTTTTNPAGNSYGPALTGKSGGGAEPVWVQERFDLSSYAGKQVLVRFEVITDEELNYRGLALDGVSIPELGFNDADAETNDAGWLAEGFIRVTDRIPQQFLVQAIVDGRETRVERLALDEMQHGTLSIAGLGAGVRGAVLVVTAIAPMTTEWAGYSYRVVPSQ